MPHPPKLSHLEWTFLSECVGGQTHVNILLPTGCFSNNATKPQAPFKTLWLLHGKSDDYTTWLRCSVIEDLAREAGIAVVMPNVGNSFYTDMDAGMQAYTYLIKELPEMLREVLPLSDKREDNYIAGFSMGGYGALKLALTQPQRYAAVGSFSAAADIVQLADHAQAQSLSMSPEEKAACLKNGINPEAVLSQRADDKRIFRSIFGDFSADALRGTKHDLFHLVNTVSTSAVPPMLLTCGTEDGLYEGDVRLRDAAIEKGLNVTWDEYPGGHIWPVWNASITRFFNLLREQSLL